MSATIPDYDKLKQQLIELMGGLPERAPLEAKTLDRWEREDHFVEYITYSGDPDYAIGNVLSCSDGHALLYIRAGQPNSFGLTKQQLTTATTECSGNLQSRHSLNPLFTCNRNS